MPHQSGSHSPGMLRAIAIFKFAKSLLLIAAGVSALKLLHKDASELILRFTERFNLSTHSRFIEGLLARTFNLEPKKLTALGIGAFFYGALFLVEGVGLWLQKHWAEYLTIISTAGFIPLEIYELTKRHNVERIIVLAINVAIVIYLVWRVRSERRGKGAPAKQPPRGWRPYVPQESH